LDSPHGHGDGASGGVYLYPSILDQILFTTEYVFLKLSAPNPTHHNFAPSYSSFIP
jgi:hypothetical protein